MCVADWKSSLPIRIFHLPFSSFRLPVSIFQGKRYHHAFGRKKRQSKLRELQPPPLGRVEGTTALSLGERVARSRRFHQPERDG